MGWFEEQNEQQDEEVCGAMSPDDSCGTCPDCRDAIDDWRELNGDDHG